MSTYDLAVAFQVFMVVLCLAFIVIMSTQKLESVTSFLFVNGFFALIHNFGYLLVLLSKDLGESLIAVKAEYFGGAFVGTFLLIFIMKFFNKKLPRVAEILLFALDILVLVSVWTCEFNHIYYNYEGLKYISDSDIPYTQIERGPLYYINVVFVVIQLVICIAVAVQAYLKEQNKKKKQNDLIIIIATLIPMIAYGLRVFKVIKIFDPTPSAIALACFVFIIAVLYGHIFEGINIAYSNIIKNMREPVVIINMEHKYVDINDSAKRMFPELRDLNPGDAVPEELIQTAKAAKGLPEVEYKGMTLQVSVYDIMYNDKQQGFSMVALDMTEEKKRLMEMQALKNEADKANVAKSKFLARMSHEIRTPVNAVIGMNEMIIRECKDDEIRKYAVDVESSAKSLMSIINDILDSSKIESGKLEIVPAEYELSSLLNDILNMTKVKADEKGIEFVMDVNENLPTRLYGDDIRIKQVVLNLLSNAVKYTHKGSVFFRIDGRRDGDDVIISIEVEDTGIGIKEEDMPKLFASFERIEESRNRAIQGTGLGMNIALSLVKLMGSELNVESEYGKGTKFSFELRQRIVSEEKIGNFKERIRNMGLNKKYKVSFVAPEANILVVDDNEMNRKVFIALLKKTQVKIDDADSGPMCLDMVRKKKYDIIFLDHMMPHMDGIETLEELKKLEDNMNTDTPVIMLTANAIVGAREKYLEIGFDNFLPKPISAGKLETMVQTYLPKELIQTVEIESDDKNEQDDLSDDTIVSIPELQEFDWKYAMSLLKSEEILMSTLEKFYHSLSPLKEELSGYIDVIGQPEYLEKFRIQVHALKSTSAMVGAILLSKLARVLEVAAKEGNVQTINAVAPVLFEEMDKHKERIATVLPDKEEKVDATDMDELRANLTGLIESIEKLDYNMGDEIMERIYSLIYESHIQKEIDALNDLVFNMKNFDAKKKAKDIIDMLGE